MRMITASLSLAAVTLSTALFAESGLDVSASALAHLDRWHEVVASNLASEAPGSKSVVMSAENARHATNGKPLIRSIASRDFSNGKIVHTGIPTHVAILTEGAFFSFDDGATYSRDGEFRWDGDTLVNKVGEPLDGQGGPITRQPAAGTVRIDSAGNVYQGTTNIATIPLFTFDNPSGLAMKPAGFTVTEESGEATPAENPRFVPEAKELSNASKIKMMTDTIRITRSQEAVAKAIQAIDERYGRAMAFAQKI